MIPHTLTIAGSDPSGGAGIQADLKTFHQHHVYGMSVITCIAPQNTVSHGALFPIPSKHVTTQLELIIQDIPIHALKIGAIGSIETAEVISHQIQKLKCVKVFDPVMIGKQGTRFMNAETIEVIKKKLLPQLDLLTPNIDEAQTLSGQTIQNKDDAITVAKIIFDMGIPNVLIKGGHLKGPPVDILYSNQGCIEMKHERIENPNTHGTGCTLSASITARLALGDHMISAITYANQWLLDTIQQGFSIGTGIGPVNHFVPTASHPRPEPTKP